MSRVLKLPRRIAREGDEEHWIPLSDLMTSLMFLFLLIALAYMVQVQQQSTRTVRVVEDYRLQHDALYDELDREFHRDLRIWGAELTPDLTIHFYKPGVLFDRGSAVLRPEFEKILANFFPRYLRILDSTKFRDAVKELRIEGTASSGWASSNSQQAYVGNMTISQERSGAVLRYVLPLKGVRTHIDWLRSHLSADGLSSSHPIIINGKEDSSLSQRVDFRIMDPIWDRVAQQVKIEHDAGQLAQQASALHGSVRGGPQVPYSVDAVTVPGAMPILINLDAHPVIGVDQSRPLSISGWATNRAGTSPVSAVFLRRDGAALIKANYGEARDDVAYALRNQALNHVGFTVDIPANTLSPTEHHFDVVIMNAQGKLETLARDRLVLDVR